MNAFRRLKLSYRFSLLILLFGLCFLTYGAWSFKTLDELKVDGPLYQRIIQSKDLIADILPPPEYIIESYLLTLQMAAAADKAEQDALATRLGTLKSQYDERHAFWLTQALEPALRDAFVKQAHEPAVAFYAIALNEFIPAIRKQDTAAISAVMARLKQAYDTHRRAIDRVVEMAVKRTEADEARAADRIQSTMFALLIMFIASVGVVITIATLITRGVLKSLGGEPDYAAQISREIAAGDLTRVITVRNSDRTSLLSAMKTMQEQLVQTVAAIKSSVDSVSTGAQQIASGNQDLSSRTEEQASSLQQTASSMEQLTSTVQQNASNAQQANQLAMSASEVAVRGGTVVSQVVDTMSSINESSKKIADIIGVIDSIAFQTNILALNAAVEAARAGEQGKGFAVVATEVRNLAQRSAAAAKEIKTLIDSSVEQVDAGAKLVDRAGVTMDEIVASVKRVTDIMVEITAASDEQRAGIEQVNQAIGQMDQVTQQNAALVEEAAAAAASLQDQAGNLAQAASAFTLDGARIKTDPTPAAVARAPARQPAVRPAGRSPSSGNAVAAPRRAEVTTPRLNDREDWAEF